VSNRDVRSTRRSDREKFDVPADFGSVWEGLGTCSGHLKNPDGRSGKPRRAVWKTQTGGLGGRRLSSARRNARAAGVAPTLTPY
jgi:hypothetical protein